MNDPATRDSLGMRNCLMQRSLVLAQKSPGTAGA
jgi:hypothetical protein